MLTCTRNTNGVCLGHRPNQSRFASEALGTTANTFGRRRADGRVHKLTGLKSQGGKLRLETHSRKTTRGSAVWDKPLWEHLTIVTLEKSLKEKDSQPFGMWGTHSRMLAPYANSRGESKSQGWKLWNRVLGGPGYPNPPSV